MSVLKRAFVYVARKWQQSLIIFLILAVVCTSVLIGAAVLKASALAAVNLRRQLGGTFNIQIDKSNPANMQEAALSNQYTGSYYVGKYLDQTVIDEVMKTSGISEYSGNIEAAANLKSGEGKYYNLIENQQNYYSSPNSHMAMIQGWTSLQQCAYFANHILEITQGEMFTDHGPGQAVISRELAEMNQIEPGDILTLEINREVTGIDFPLEKQECSFEIVGIFDICGEQQINQFTSQRQMLQNWVFVDSRTLLAYMNGLLESIGEPPLGYAKVTFSVDDPAEMDAIMKNVQDNQAIQWNYFKLEIDNTNYQSAESALKSMDGAIYIMILVMTAAGIGILILLLSIWAKSRIYETGILLSVGRSKWEILAQRMTEILLITILSFVLSYACSNIAANDVGNMLLSQANEQNAVDAKENPMRSDLSISADNFDLTPVFSAPEVEELIVDISFDMIAAVYAVEVLIVLLSVCVAGIPVMSIKPKIILAKCE